MSNPKTNKELLDEGNITEALMMAYVNNTLSAGERQQFEKLLADDPFAQDALEGLQATQNVQAATASIARVKSKVRERTGAGEAKVVKMHWTNYAWAAAIFAMLIGIGFLMVGYMGKKADTMAMNEQKESKATEQSTPFLKSADKNQSAGATTVTATDSGSFTLNANGTSAPPATSFDMESKPSGAVAENGKQEEHKFAAPVPASEGVIKQSTEQKNLSTSPAAGMNSTITANNGTAAVPDGKKNAASYNTVPAQAPASNRYDDGLYKEERKSPARDEDLSEVVVSSNKKDKAKETTGSTSIEDARGSFNSGDYKKAGDQFDAVLKKDPNNPDALYFGGITDYINGKTNKSEKNFDKLLQDGKRYQEGSKWYKANILLKKGKKEEARKLLQDLANSSGSYKERAVQKLEEVK
ncbi:MAG: hypothetical protein U0T75_15780 [Chitinophagales bacterium]